MRRKSNRFKIQTYEKGGNKSEWISDKISKIMNENPDMQQDRAIAIAYSMYDNKDKQLGGEQPKSSNLKNIYGVQRDVFNPGLGYGVKMFYRDKNDPNFNPETDTEFVKNDAFENMVVPSEQYKEYQRRIQSGTTFQPTQLAGDYEIPKYAPQKTIKDIKYDVSTSGDRQGLPQGTYTRVTYNDGTFDYLNPQGEEALKKMNNYRTYQSKNSTPRFEAGGMQDMTFSTSIDGFQMESPEEKGRRRLADLQKISLTDTSQLYTPQTAQDKNFINKYDTRYQQPPQFINPYGGVDLETASSRLGQSIASGDTLGTIASSAKLATGLTRNVFSGLGAEKLKEEQLKNYYDNQRDTLTGFQDGGEQMQDPTPMIMEALQQGMQPEQIIQQLVQMGMDEGQATQMLQQILNQELGQASQEQPIMREGGEFLGLMTGKKILGYNYNKESDSYTINYE